MSTELTVTERAQKALSIEHTEAQLKAMARKSSDIKEIKDDTDYHLVKSSRITLKGVRVDIQKAGKSARDDANKFGKAVIAEEKRLIHIISPEEIRLAALQEEVDSKVAREAEEKRKAEEVRIQSVIDSIEEMKIAGNETAGTSDEISNRTSILTAHAITEDVYQEYLEQAKEVHSQAIQSLNNAYHERLEFENQKAEQERVAKEQAERQAEIDRQEAERKAEDEKRQAEIRRQEEELKAKQDKFEADRKAEADRKLEAERAEAEKVRMEKERLEQEQKDREAAEIKAAEEEAESARQEALKPEKERLIDWLKKLRFIDGVELHDEKLVLIQSQVLHDLSTLSENALADVENA